jgi:hypothetical protein
MYLRRVLVIGRSVAAGAITDACLYRWRLLHKISTWASGGPAGGKRVTEYLRAYISAHSIGFCASWACISLSFFRGCCSKLRAPHLGTTLGPIVCGARAHSCTRLAGTSMKLQSSFKLIHSLLAFRGMPPIPMPPTCSSVSNSSSNSNLNSKSN